MKYRLFTIFVAITFICKPCFSQINQHAHEKIDLAIAAEAPKKKNALLHAVKIPVTLIGLGIYATAEHNVINRYEIREERNEHMPHFHCPLDNYMMHVPVLAVYGLNIAGVKGKHDFRNRTLLLVKSEMIMAALTFSVKKFTHVERPDDSNNFSFPSGHTAQAFATATFMAKEYGDESIWYSVGAYTMATTVGVMRILNNRHWISDVLAGAGIGILSTNLAYLTHKYRWKNKNSDLTVIPTYNNGPGIYLGYTLH
ncbi:phosphatase PAP2 family protein [Ohtaekwangia sp.]|uniref:phosphatase PAP2 family protein n=1 Tax=Ohtaekwangia sp. TaxID=2066019 RepID=UPI002F95BB98